MKELIPVNNHGLFCDAKDTARVDSRYVAQVFNKRHGDALRAIENMLLLESGLTSEFGQRNFASSSQPRSATRPLQRMIFRR